MGDHCSDAAANSKTFHFLNKADDKTYTPLLLMYILQETIQQYGDTYNNNNLGPEPNSEFQLRNYKINPALMLLPFIRLRFQIQSTDIDILLQLF